MIARNNGKKNEMLNIDDGTHMLNGDVDMIRDVRSMRPFTSTTSAQFSAQSRTARCLRGVYDHVAGASSYLTHNIISVAYLKTDINVIEIDFAPKKNATRWALTLSPKSLCGQQLGSLGKSPESTYKDHLHRAKLHCEYVGGGGAILYVLASIRYR